MGVNFGKIPGRAIRMLLFRLGTDGVCSRINDLQSTENPHSNSLMLTLIIECEEYRDGMSAGRVELCDFGRRDTTHIDGKRDSEMTGKQKQGASEVAESKLPDHARSNPPIHSQSAPNLTDLPWGMPAHHTGKSDPGLEFTVMRTSLPGSQEKIRSSHILIALRWIP